MDEKVITIVRKYNGDKGQLVSILQDIQAEYYYLPEEALIQVSETMERCLSIKRGETTKDHMFTLETVNCMGCCAVGPAVKIDGDYYGHMSPDKIDSLLDKF